MDWQDTQSFTGNLRALLFGIDSKDIELTISLMVWLTFIWFAVRLIQATDWLVGSLYVAYCVFLGFTLCLALPQRFDGLGDLQTMFYFFIAFSLISSLLFLRKFLKTRSIGGQSGSQKEG